MRWSLIFRYLPIKFFFGYWGPHGWNDMRNTLNGDLIFVVIRLIVTTNKAMPVKKDAY